MKRWLILLLAAALLLQSGCAWFAREMVDDEQPVLFYYLASADAPYVSQTGALLAEERTLGTTSYTWYQLLRVYLRGPQDPLLETAFPAELEVEAAELTDKTLTIWLNGVWDTLTGMDRQLAEACLVMTATQFEEVQSVKICTKAMETEGTPCEPLNRSSFLLYDDFATSDQITVKLYFSDVNGRFLVEETRDRSADAKGSLPDFIVRQLLAGPKSENALPALPEGTSVLRVQVEQGVCTVSFSEAFLSGKPVTHTQARMAVFSVVNSLTELPEVDCVRFLCVGEPIGDYAGLDLSQSMYREEMALSPGRTGGASVEATLYVPCGTDGKLAAVPASIRKNAGKSEVDAILSSLLTFKPANGYENPFPDGTVVVELSVVGHLCKVTFNNAFALLSEEPEQMEMAIRSLVTTLCAREDIHEVQIDVYNTNLQAEGMQEPIAPSADWVLP